MPFMNEMFAEQMEKTITEAKGEFESFLQNKINSIALETIAGKQKEEISKTYNRLLLVAETGEIPSADAALDIEEEEHLGMEMGGMHLG